jgi:hypothetical protein
MKFGRIEQPIERPSESLACGRFNFVSADAALVNVSRRQSGRRT